MNPNTAISFSSDLLFDDEPQWLHTRGNARRQKAPKFSVDNDIELWLKYNAPLTFRQLADIRYCPYHYCSRAYFTVTCLSDDQFDLSGRHTTLRLISDRARGYLLWKLRLLGRKKSCTSALPRTKNPRRKETI